ncbi:MAG: hypothetical protein ACLFVB_05500 [Thermoplasmata archaeon]
MPEEERFGTQKKIKEYRWMVYIGIILTIAGAVLSPLGKIIEIEAVYLYSLAGIFIGIMVLASGILGVREETSKKGERKISTTSGGFSMVSGVAGVFIANRIPILSVILGMIAVLLGWKALKNDDNVYGSTGTIIGIVGIAIGIYIAYIFDYWWPFSF